MILIQDGIWIFNHLTYAFFIKFLTSYGKYSCLKGVGYRVPFRADGFGFPAWRWGWKFLPLWEAFSRAKFLFYQKLNGPSSNWRYVFVFRSEWEVNSHSGYQLFKEILLYPKKCKTSSGCNIYSESPFSPPQQITWLNFQWWKPQVGDKTRACRNVYGNQLLIIWMLSQLKPNYLSTHGKLKGFVLAVLWEWETGCGETRQGEPLTPD